MYRTEASETGREFKIISQSAHIAKVKELIEKNFDTCFKSFIESYRSSDSMEKLRAKWGRNMTLKSDAECIKELFAQIILEYEKEAEKYRDAFDQETIEEFHFDENAFKGYLIQKCPVITHSFHSKAEELAEWKKFFAMTPSVDLLDTFDNLITFSSEYIDDYDELEYQDYTNSDEFGFDEVEEEDYGITGVIGMGIKAITLYHLHPAIFPRRGKPDLFGMYFLTDKSFFRLPTKSSEFIMVNDKANGPEGVYKVDQNYWYPYGLFTSYAMYLYHMICDRCKQLGVSLDPHYRYVYVNAYLENIFDQHAEDVRTLTRSSADHDRVWYF